METLMRKTCEGWQLIRVNKDGAVHVDPDGYPLLEIPWVPVWYRKLAIAYQLMEIEESLGDAD